MNQQMGLRERCLQSRDVVAFVSDKWGIGVLHLLSRGPLQTSRLQRGLETISLKVLTQTLRRMERDGLVERRPYAVVPPRVEYQLTEMGRSLLKGVIRMSKFVPPEPGPAAGGRRHGRI